MEGGRGPIKIRFQNALDKLSSQNEVNLRQCAEGTCRLIKNGLSQIGLGVCLCATLFICVCMWKKSECVCKSVCCCASVCKCFLGGLVELVCVNVCKSLCVV